MPGISIGSGVPFTNGIGWANYWAKSGLFLFFGETSRITGGKLYNQVTGATDWMDVSGTGLNTVYETPDEDTYRTADSDYCWWKTDLSRSVTDGNRLIAYDFERTLVKYDNTSPYVIRWIAILNPASSVTNAMRDSFDLSIWWDNTLSFHGAVKQNKPLPEQYVWTAESVIEAETAALVARMTAVSETPDAARITVLDTAIAADKAAIGFTSQYDAMWLLAAHGNDSALLNIIKDAHNCTLVSTPTFLTDRHYVGDGIGAALNANYNPSTQASKYLQNACSYGIYIRNNIDEVSEVMSCLTGASIGIGFIPRIAPNKYIRVNSDYQASGNADSSGMWIFVRTTSNNFNIYRNGLYVDNAALASAALPNAVLHLLARNLSGTISLFSTFQVALAFVGGVMDQTKVTAFQTIWVDGYLNTIGAKI